MRSHRSAAGGQKPRSEDDLPYNLSKRLIKAEIKQRSYSHEDPDCSLLGCKSCQKECSDLSDGLCPRCTKGLQKAESFACSWNGHATLGFECRSIVYTCHRGHKWTASFQKATRSWCVECRKYVKEQKRQQLQKEYEQEQQRSKNLQSELFLQAREKLRQLEEASRIKDLELLFEAKKHEAIGKATLYAQEQQNEGSETIAFNDALPVYNILLFDSSSLDEVSID